MASRPTQVSVGGIVNPLDGLQNAVGNVFDQYSKNIQTKREMELRAAERAENQRRWETTNKRDQALYDLKMGEAKKALQDKAVLQEFDPQGVEGTRAAWNSNVARDTSEGVGKYLEAINLEASQASPEKLAQMIADKKILQTKDGSIIPFVNEEAGRNLKSYLDDSITQESAAIGYTNLLRGKGIDPVTAREEGKLLSEGLISRKDILDAEEKQTKYINENKKHNLKQLIEQGKLDSKFYNPSTSKSSNKTSLKGYAKDWNEFQAKQSDYDVSTIDMFKWGNAGTIEKIKETAMKLGDVTPAALDKALNNSIVRNVFGDNFGDLTEDQAVSKILKLAKDYDTASKTGYANPQSRRIVLGRDNLVTERSFNEIMRDKSDSAVENFRKLMGFTPSTTASTSTPPGGQQGNTPPGGSGSGDNTPTGGGNSTQTTSPSESTRPISFAELGINSTRLLDENDRSPSVLTSSTSERSPLVLTRGTPARSTSNSGNLEEINELSRNTSGMEQLRKVLPEMTKEQLIKSLERYDELPSDFMLKNMSKQDIEKVVLSTATKNLIKANKDAELGYNLTRLTPTKAFDFVEDVFSSSGLGLEDKLAKREKERNSEEQNLNYKKEYLDNVRRELGTEEYKTPLEYLKDWASDTRANRDKNVGKFKSLFTRPENPVNRASIEESLPSKRNVLLPASTEQGPTGRLVDFLEFNIRPEDNPDIGLLKNEYPTGSYTPYKAPTPTVSSNANLVGRQTQGISDYVGSNKGLAEQVIKEALSTGNRKYQDNVMQAVSGKHPELVKKYFSNFYDTSVSETGANINKQAKAIAKELGISESEAMRMVMEEMVKTYSK